MAGLIAAGGRLDRADSPTVDLEPHDRLVEVDPPPFLLDRQGHRLPHLARAVARIVELLDQRSDLAPVVPPYRRTSSREEGDALDALRGPLGADLGGRHAPDLLRVRPEEQLEE